MLTTASRLQHLDSYLLFPPKRRDPLPTPDPVDTLPTLCEYNSAWSSSVSLASSSSSWSTVPSETYSFHSAVSSTETREDCIARTSIAGNPDKTLAREGRKKYSEDNGQRPATDFDAQRDGNQTTLASGTVRLEHQSWPSRTARNTRQASTNSEPLPRPSIPLRSSSTYFDRRRSGQDLISFHRDSCRLFQSLAGTLNAEQARAHSRPTHRHSMTEPSARYDRRAFSTPHVISCAEASLIERLVLHPSPQSTTSITTLEVPVEIAMLDDRTLPFAPKSMSWMSDQSREQEYFKIDRAHGGIWGFWRKVTPKWCHGSRARRNFFHGECDGDSVRRFRLSTSGETVS
jgi:hypothetical protein